MQRIIPLILFALFGAAVMPATALAASSVSVRALLITASKGKGSSDPRLAPYEATLRRTLRFESFKLVDEGSASLTGDGPATVSLGRHRLKLTSSARRNGGIPVRVEWTHAGREVMTTALTLKAGTPAVLGRAGSDSEVPVVLLIAR